MTILIDKQRCMRIVNISNADKLSPLKLRSAFRIVTGEVRHIKMNVAASAFFARTSLTNFEAAEFPQCRESQMVTGSPFWAD